MKKQNFIFTHFIVINVFVVFILACGGSKSVTTPPTNAPNSPVESPAKTTNNSSSNSDSVTKDVAGEYAVTGSNVNGQGSYSGSLAITKRGEVYQFSWNVAGVKYDGVGVQTDNYVSVSYAEGTNGEGCGVQLYKINSDGTLEGKSGYWGNDTSESERAVRTSGTDLAGEYDVTGKNPGGDEYKSKLTILPSGPGFTFKWKGANNIDGLGVRLGNLVTAGFGGQKCGFVAFEIKPDGSLEGKWGGIGTVNFGTEKAIRK